MEFDWDPEKNRKNQKKHGVSFEEASTVFWDPFAWSFEDFDHSGEENRWIIIGYSLARRMLLVAHKETARGFRIISAREATAFERNKHEKQSKK